MVDMKVFLAVDENGVKLATKAVFWKSATPMMMAIDTKIIRKFMRTNGWVRKDINTAMKQRDCVTPEGREKSRESARKRFNTPEGREKSRESNRKRISTPEGREKANAANKEWRNTPERREKARARTREWRSTPFGRERIREWHRKNRSTIFGRLAHNSSTATQKVLKFFGKEKTERAIHYLGCTDKEFHEWCITFMKPDIRIGVYDYLTHDKDPVYQIDHGMPKAIVAKNQHIEGLVDFCISYKNQRPIDARFNHLKVDYIILELIHPDCPALPYINNLNGVDRVFQTVDEFLVFMGRSRSEFPLL